MPATDNGVSFVRLWIAAATALAVCTFGCRQLDTPAIVSIDRSRPALAPERSPPQIVAACRFPIGEPHESASMAPDEVDSFHFHFAEGADGAGPLSYCGCELSPLLGDNATDRPASLLADSPDAINPPPPPGNAGDRGFKTRCAEILATTRDDVLCDYANYYNRRTAVEFVVILAPAAAFANSDWDADVGNWYQQHIRSNDTNRAADFFRPLGNGYYTIPVYVSAKLLGEYFDDWAGMGLLGEFGDRTTRVLLVGAPPLLAVQYLADGGRPSSIEDQSYWRPFHSSHGASGHAFMGAVPFLTLAGMTDDPLAKCFFYACSPWTGISRINDNYHYASQVWFGWWLAYLACDAVNKTEKEQRPATISSRSGFPA